MTLSDHAHTTVFGGLVVLLLWPSPLFSAPQDREEGSRSSPTGNPVADERSAPLTYFLGVGIDDYEHNSDWPTLRGARNDLDSIMTVLGRLYHVEVSDSMVLRDDSATAKTILNLVKSFVQSPESTDDANAIFYYAGHGTVIGEQVFLIPHDGLPMPTNPGDQREMVQRPLFATAHYSWVPLTEILTLFEEIYEDSDRLRQVLIVLDACYAGTQTGIYQFAGGGDPPSLHERSAREIFTAAGFRQEAGERQVINATYEGIFTGHLHRQLNRAATAYASNLRVRSEDIYKPIATSMGDPKQQPLHGYFGESWENTRGNAEDKGLTRSRFTFWLKSTDERAGQHRITKLNRDLSEAFRSASVRLGGADGGFFGGCNDNRYGMSAKDVEDLVAGAQNEEAAITVRLQRWYINVQCAELAEELPDWVCVSHEEYSNEAKLIDNRDWGDFRRRYKALLGSVPQRRSARGGECS